MNVLYIVTAYPRWEGDVITPWLTETIRRLRESGVSVEVLAPAYRGGGAEELDGVRVHRFRYAPAALETLTHDQTAPDRIRERPRYAALVPSYVAAGSLAAAKLARSGRFDVVHAFWPIPHGIAGAAAKWLGGVPLVSTFFGVELTWVAGQLRPLAPVLRGVVRASDAVTVISSHTATRLRELVPGGRVVTIPFGAAVAPAVRVASRPRAPGDPLRLLFIGRLVERKGVRFLLDALGRTDSSVTLTVVGDGPLRGALEAHAAALGLGGRVEFTGAVTSSHLTERLENADALVLPAVEDRKGDVEGLGVVLIEALAHGRPVIASASGGIVDVVKDGETGLLVPPADAAALADAIERFRTDPALAARLAESGRSHVADVFSWEGIIERLNWLYADVARRAGTRAGG